MPAPGDQDSQFPASQLARVVSERDFRFQLLQEELDRRFVGTSSLWDEKIAGVFRALHDLRLMLDERYATQVKETDKAFQAQQTAMRTAFDSADRAVQAALAAAKEASIKAELAADSRFSSVNEFRGQLADQAQTFLPRQEFVVALGALSEKVDVQRERVSALELRLSSQLERGAGGVQATKDNRQDSRAVLGLALTAAGLLVAFLTFLVIHG